MSWFWTSTDSSPPLKDKFPYSFFVSLCMNVFGEQYTEKFIRARNVRTNKIFGSRIHRKNDKVFYLYSDSDPNKLIGPDFSLMPEFVNWMLISHVGRFFALSPGLTSDELLAKETIRQMIAEWTK